LKHDVNSDINLVFSIFPMTFLPGLPSRTTSCAAYLFFICVFLFTARCSAEHSFLCLSVWS